MQILSFDTSGNDVQIALMQDGQIVLSQRLAPPVKNRQESASMLLPAIDAALKKLSWRKADLDLIVVGVGPGSFTGVRVAVITARSIGQALELAVFPVSSLEILALKGRRPCAVILNAGAGKFYMGEFDHEHSQETSGQLLEPFCGNLQELYARLAHLHDWVLEPGLEELVSAAGKTIVVYPADANLASDAAALAHDRISASATKLKREALAKAYPWDNVLPLYLRSPSVTLKADNGSSNQTIASG